MKKLRNITISFLLLFSLFTLFGCISYDFDKTFEDVKKVTFKKGQYNIKFYTNNFQIKFNKIEPYQSNGIITAEIEKENLNPEDKDMLKLSVKKNKLIVNFNLEYNVEQTSFKIILKNNVGTIIGRVVLNISLNKDILSEKITLLKSKLSEVTKVKNTDPKENKFDKSFLGETFYDKFEKDIRDSQKVYKDKGSSQLKIAKEVLKLDKDVEEFEKEVFKGEKPMEPSDKVKLISAISFAGFIFVSLLIIFLVFFFYNRKRIRKAKNND